MDSNITSSILASNIKKLFPVPQTREPMTKEAKCTIEHLEVAD